MLDGLDNLIFGLVHQDDIAVLAHDFHHQRGLYLVSDFILIGNAYFQNSVIFQLLDAFDDGSLEILTQDHGKGIGHLGIGKIRLGQLDAAKDRVGRNQKLEALALAADMKDQLLFKGLVDFLNAATLQFFLQFRGHVV